MQTGKPIKMQMPVDKIKSIMANKGRMKMIGKYFAIARELGVEGVVAKDKAKAMFKLEHFNDITNEQLVELLKEGE